MWNWLQNSYELIFNIFDKFSRKSTNIIFWMYALIGKRIHMSIFYFGNCIFENYFKQRNSKLHLLMWPTLILSFHDTFAQWNFSWPMPFLNQEYNMLKTRNFKWMVFKHKHRLLWVVDQYINILLVFHQFIFGYYYFHIFMPPQFSTHT